MYRQFQLLSNGSGAVAAGQTLLVTSQSPNRDYQIPVAMAGTSAARPKQGDPDFLIGVQGGVRFLDLSLGYIVISDGTGQWRNPMTGAVV
jgi:hypothetical protein